MENTPPAAQEETMEPERRQQGRVVIIGAGIGGLTTAAVLARAGLDVTVLEAHIYPGGCAGTFFHQGYHFDAGATLAGGFYPGGPMEQVAQAAGIPTWPAQPCSDMAMAVHLPGANRINLHAGERRWEERQSFFGASAEPFFRWQEKTADMLWDLALRLPPWPAQSIHDVLDLARKAWGWWTAGDQKQLTLAGLALDAFQPVSAHLHGADERLRLFVDGQLLISAQTTSRYANALYGASALDLPRRGVVHVEGGIGAIAQTLAQAVRQHGGRIEFRQEVVQIRYEGGRPVAVRTRHGDFPADWVIANLPLWNIARLSDENSPGRLQYLSRQPVSRWGAFVVYLGVDGSVIPTGSTLHHQVIAQRPLGEGNSIFLSISPAWDVERAPAGRRAITISTHTALRPWWQHYQEDRTAYEARKAGYAYRLLGAAEAVLPGLSQAAELILPGTPVTFQRFTRRERGWVGGFPQESLLRARGPRLGNGLWMVGDSIFPGQSMAAVALGGLRVAQAVLQEFGLGDPVIFEPQKYWNQSPSKA